MGAEYAQPLALPCLNFFCDYAPVASNKKTFLLAKGSVLNSTYRLRLVDTLVIHDKGVTKGFGLTSLSGVRRGFMPPQLNTNKNFGHLSITCSNYQFVPGSIFILSKCGCPLI